MKRILCILLSVLLLCMFTACQTVQYEYYSGAEWENEQEEQENMDDTQKTKKTTVNKTETKKTTQGSETKETTKQTAQTQKTEKTRKTKQPDTTFGSIQSTTKASEPVKYEKQSELLKYVVEEERALTLGRVAWNGTFLKLPQSLSGVRFAGWLTGGMSVELNVKSTPGTYMTIVTDGDYSNAKTVWVKSGDSTLQLVENLPKGFHTVEVLRASTAPYPETIVGRVTYCGRLEKPAYRDLQMEFIGDSITGGEGNWDDTDKKNAYSVKYCNSYETYAAKTARALGAEINVLAQCGWRTDHAAGTFSPFGSPDIVVINLGTNVYGITEDQVVSNLKTLISNARRGYGANTYIIWAYGMMNTESLSLLKDAVAEMQENDDRLLFCDLTSVKDQKGTQLHPSAEGHTAAANLLTKFIKDNCKDAL